MIMPPLLIADSTDAKIIAKPNENRISGHAD
jgi:hypothetical protein